MEPLTCEICHRELATTGHYIVRIDVFADPAMPPATRDELNAIDFDAEIDNLLDEMKDMTPDELQDQVHRRFEFRICPRCQRQFLRDPLGKSGRAS
jgi:hypothetical protein